MRVEIWRFVIWKPFKGEKKNIKKKKINEEKYTKNMNKNNDNEDE